VTGIASSCTSTPTELAHAALPELSVGWVDPWVGLGWVEIFQFLVGWVGLGPHTHPFNSPLSRTTQVSRYQKGITNLDFTGARDSERQWYQLDHMQVCTSLQTDNHKSTSLLKFFTGRMPFLPPNQQCQSTEGTTAKVQKKFARIILMHLKHGKIIFGCTKQLNLTLWPI